MSEDNNKSEKISVTFKISDDEKQLIAELPSGTDVSLLNIIQFKKLIQDNGYTDWHLIDDALSNACGLLGKFDQTTEVIIGDRLDGELLIEVADDTSCAYMSVTPPQLEEMQLP